MKATAKERYIRISPRKVRVVADLIKGLEVNQALSTLRFSPKAGAKVLFKLLTAAQANAYQQETNRSGDLFVANTIVDPGPTLKRVRPRARGSRDIIRKRTSHVTVFVDAGRGES